MKKTFRILYWFEYGGPCMWAMDDVTKEKYGYPIHADSLPLSKEVIKEIISLEKEYQSSLDWDYPPDPSPWTEEQKLDFLLRAQKLYYVMQRELGPDFEITNHISSCV
jgi:hypothetical protein